MLMPATVVSQESGDQHEETLLGTLGEDGGIILSDAAAYFSAPFRFTGGDWLTAAGAAGGTVLLMTVDDEMKGLLGSENTGSLNGDFWDIPTRYGLVGPANILSVVLYSSGLALDSRDVRVTGRLLFESLTLSGISVMAIRYIFGRSRPYDNNSPWDFNWFETANEVQSFPSGHTTVAFAMSTVFAERIGGVWARVGFYGLASMTAYARVRNNQHWVSDVVAGAGLGLLAGFHVVQRERMREQGELSGGLEIYPTLQGLQVVYRF